MAATFDDFFKAALDGVKELAQSTLKDFVTEAQTDGLAFLDRTKDELRRWTVELANGELTAADFEDLLQGRKELAEMTLLKQQGLAQVRIDTFVNSVLSVVANAGVKTFLG